MGDLRTLEFINFPRFDKAISYSQDVREWGTNFQEAQLWEGEGSWVLGRVEKGQIEENKMGLSFFYGFGDLKNGEIFHFFLKWNFDGWKSIWKFAKRIIIEKTNYFFHFFSTSQKICRILTDSIVKTIAQTNIRKKSYGVFTSFLARFKEKGPKMT